MAGGGHQPVSRSMEAKLFEGHPENEGWETTIYVTYAASFVLITFALGFAPDTSIKTVSFRYCGVNLSGIVKYLCLSSTSAR